jgi:hypothetical protein
MLSADGYQDKEVRKQKYRLQTEKILSKRLGLKENRMF